MRIIKYKTKAIINTHLVRVERLLSSGISLFVTFLFRDDSLFSIVTINYTHLHIKKKDNKIITLM